MESKFQGESKLGRYECPIANTLDVVGDRWTLIIVRDIIIEGKHRYNEFLDSPEGITTNILADRLKRMEEFGLLDKRPYQDNPTRYEYHLTPSGLALEPVLHEMISWGLKHVPGQQ